jgi:palmitoyltransferase
LVLFSSLPFYLSSWLVPFWLYGSNQLVQNFVIKDIPGAAGQIHKTPYLGGIFTGTALLVALRWLFTILPSTFSAHPILNIVFGIVFATAMYCFAQAVVSDPGFLPRPAGISEQKKIVEELVVRGEFDARHFCTSCFVRKSLRSKHCRICERCVARHDQYVPLYPTPCRIWALY